MFKIGDRVLFNGDLTVHNLFKSFITGNKEYEVKSLYVNNNGNNMFTFINDQGVIDHFGQDWFKLCFRSEPKNDLEWMNRVQENFREGI